METWLVVLLVALGVVLVVGLILAHQNRSARRFTNPAPVPTSAPPPPPASAAVTPPSDELVERVRQLKRDGQVIWAIKALKEGTGMSLKDSKEFVDALV